jgi:hypothetical protein
LSAAIEIDAALAVAAKPTTAMIAIKVRFM